MREKKSENLEVRLPHRLKEAFMARCRAEGCSASEVVRQMIETYLARPAVPATPELPVMLRPRIAVPAALAAGAAAVLFAASTSQAGPDLREAFQALDRDRDGVLTVAEFSAGGRDKVIFVGKPERAIDGPMFTVPLTKTPQLDAAGAAVRRQPLPAGRIYASIDVDQNGAVDFSEYARHHEKLKAQSFASLDSDKDGRITGDEFWGPVGRGAELPGLKESLRQTFVRLDADRDGAISRAEYEAF